MDLGGQPANVQAATVADENAGPLAYRYYPDSPGNFYIDAARRLPEVQTVMWFARFPVTHFHTEGAIAVVEISDLRFPQTRPDRPAPFTYRVRFASDGRMLSQGWMKPLQ
jgi:hypothetical protein